jgi:hypothetical protein
VVLAVEALDIALPSWSGESAIIWQPLPPSMAYPSSLSSSVMTAPLS